MDFTRCYSCMGELDRPGGRCPHCGFDNTPGSQAQSSHALPCGFLLHGRYVIGKMLGQGGFGVTYIGWDLALELRVCIKEYFPAGAALRSNTMSTTVTWSGGENAEELKRGRESFIKEARKAVKLRKLNAVVQVWDVFYENDTAYLVMDYIDGVTLKSHLIETRRPLSEEECVRLLTPLMEDLEEVHARGIIHRDISPDNLMLQPDGTLVLLDIGAAKDLSGGNGQSSVLVAKKGFSPLEQYASGGNIGPWTDVYALCATIVYCVTGKLLPSPMDRLTGAELDLSAFSPSFAEVLQRGLAIRPEERIQSMEELSARLEKALKEPAPAHEPEPEIPLPEPEPKPMLVIKSSPERQRIPEEQIQRAPDPEPEVAPDPVCTPEPESTPMAFCAEKQKNKGRIPKWTIAAAFFVCIAAGLIVTKLVLPAMAYQKAEKLLNDGYYYQAAEAFAALSGYSDSTNRMNEASYLYAKQLLKDQQYEKAHAVFEALPGFKDSKRLSNECNYQFAAQLFSRGKYQDAYSYYSKITDYKDSRDRAAESMYLYAIERFDAEEFSDAVNAFVKIKDYKDVSERLLEAQYRYALALSVKEDWRQASTLFKQLGDYQDSAKQYKETNYQYGLQLLSEERYQQAVPIFKAVEDYKESRKKLNEAKYGYVVLNKNSTDLTTYYYLKELKSETYKDSAEIYDLLYALKVSIVFNDSETNEYAAKSISKFSTWYAHVKLIGGPPLASVSLKYKINWPDGDTSSDRWSFKWGRGDSGWVNGYYNSPENGATGTVRIRVYDEATGTLIGEGTGTIID